MTRSKFKGWKSCRAAVSFVVLGKMAWRRTDMAVLADILRLHIRQGPQSSHDSLQCDLKPLDKVCDCRF